MSEPHPERSTDRAVADRLARLRAMPVDTSGLDVVLHEALALPSTSERTQRVRFIGRTRSWAAAAAVLIVATLATVLLVASSGQAVAAPAEMANMHRKLVAGTIDATRVSTVAEAERVVQAQWGQAPAMPAMPADHLAACCLKSVKNRPVACLLFDDGDSPISVMVAKADDFVLPDGGQQRVDGVDYRVTSADGVNMVLSERAGRLVCVMGTAPVQRLIELAARMRF